MQHNFVTGKTFFFLYENVFIKPLLTSSHGGTLCVVRLYRDLCYLRLLSSQKVKRGHAIEMYLCSFRYALTKFFERIWSLFSQA